MEDKECLQSFDGESSWITTTWKTEEGVGR